jgi:hypothetical protein
VFVVGELNDFLDFSSTARKALEDLVKASTRLHRDNAELILFVNPDEEGLFLVVEDTATVWPVTVKTDGLEETISLPEKFVRAIK